MQTLAAQEAQVGHTRISWLLAYWIAVFIITVLLSGCAAAPSPTPAAQAMATIVPSATPMPSPTPSYTASPVPTATATATSTPHPTETPLPTATETPEPTATPVPQAAAPTQPPGAAGSAGSIAAKPSGSSAVHYAIEFPPISPAGAPPGYGGHTNPLTGLHVDDANLIHRRPILVRYGNDGAARPPAGIAQADIVLEDLMDAFWITRITAVFLRNEPNQVGPVRSARPVNIDLLHAFDGVFVYSGASIGVNQLLAQHPFHLIHEDYQGDLFFRSAQRRAPHNLFTALPKVRERIRGLGWERGASLRGLTFGDGVPAGAPASRVHIPLPSSSTVVWTWDAGAGVYRRWVQGVQYTDALTGEHIGVQNVIVLYARHWNSDIIEDSLGSRAIGIALKGGERVQVFRDGQVIDGFWWREDANMLFQLIDANGQHIPLKPGQSWIQIVPTTYQLGIQ